MSRKKKKRVGNDKAPTHLPGPKTSLPGGGTVSDRQPLKEVIRENRLWLGLLVTLALGLYLGALNNEFVSDDIGAIAQSTDVQSYDQIFRSPLSLVRFFQPFLQVTTYKIFGLIPAVFRLPNLLFHAGAVVMLFVLVRQLVGKSAALIAALLLAAHPMAVESVAWISGGGHVMYAFFLLAALWLWTKTPHSPKAVVGTVAAFGLAISVSEKAMSFPLSLALFAWAHRLYPKNWKRYLPLTIPFVIIGVVLLMQVPTRIEWLQRDYYQTGGMGNPLVTAVVGLSSYLELTFWPDKLTLYHSELMFSKPYFIFKIILVLGYLVMTGVLLKKDRRIGFWAAFFGLSLAPVLLMANFGIAWVVAERYAYAGVIGVYVLVAWALAKLGGRLKNMEPIWVAVGILTVALGIRTIVRNNDWQNQDTLWLAAARTSPSSAQNHNNLGDLYARRGDFPKAAEEFQQAIRLKPNYGDAYHNLANVYHQMGRDELAVANYQKALEFNPNIWQSYQNIGFILYEQGEYQKAEESLAKAASINPVNPTLRVAYGITLFKNSQIRQAKAEFEAALALDPQNQQAKTFLQRIQENFDTNLPE